jgi:hypothetical protein
LEELRKAYERFVEVCDRCAVTADYNAFADLFTEDCTYIEHVFGEMHGREEVRQWIVPLMRSYPNDQMVLYTHDWTLFDEENGRMVFCARTHMADPGDGSKHSATNSSSCSRTGKRPRKKRRPDSSYPWTRRGLRSLTSLAHYGTIKGRRPLAEPNAEAKSEPA